MDENIYRKIIVKCRGMSEAELFDALGAIKVEVKHLLPASEWHYAPAEECFSRKDVPDNYTRSYAQAELEYRFIHGKREWVNDFLEYFKSRDRRTPECRGLIRFMEWKDFTIKPRRRKIENSRFPIFWDIVECFY